MNEYYHLPANKVEAIPWGKLLVDLMCLYKNRREVPYDPIIIKYLTVIYP